MYHHGVEYIVDLCHAVFLPEQSRSHHAQDLAVCHAPGLTDELDIAAHQTGCLHIGGCDSGNALGKDLVRVGMLAKEQICQDARLAAGIDALDVGGGSASA